MSLKILKARLLLRGVLFILQIRGVQPHNFGFERLNRLCIFHILIVEVLQIGQARQLINALQQTKCSGSVFLPITSQMGFDNLVELP